MPDTLPTAEAAYHDTSRAAHRAAGAAQATLALLDRAEAAEWRVRAIRDLLDEALAPWRGGGDGRTHHYDCHTYHADCLARRVLAALDGERTEGDR